MRCRRMTQHSGLLIFFVLFYVVIVAHALDTPIHRSQEKEKRGADIVGFSVLVGLRAVKDLLTGATRVQSPGPLREFVKSGGYERAIDDFYSTNPSFVHSFEITDGIHVLAGRVGDRQLILKHTGRTKNPTLEIMQMSPVQSNPHRYSIMSKVTDKISYTE